MDAAARTKMLPEHRRQMPDDGSVRKWTRQRENGMQSCDGCQKRTVDCHGHCGDYAADKILHIMMVADEAPRKETDKAMYERKYKLIQRHKKKTRRR